MKKKSIILVVIIIILVGSIQQKVYANSVVFQDENQTRFTNIISYENDFYISNTGKATFTSETIARNTDVIKINSYLQRYLNGSWRTIKSWSMTQNGSSLLVDENYYVLSGYTYRMVSYVYVYGDDLLLESVSYISDLRIF